MNMRISQDTQQDTQQETQQEAQQGAQQDAQQDVKQKTQRGTQPGTRVLVAMSGGVDSAIAAHILKTQGYDCVGVTLLLHGCATEAQMSDIHDARQTAEKLGIPHHVEDCSGLFEHQVVRGFVQGYLDGGTPNPCVVCNRHIKFGVLWQLAQKWGVPLLATGHYARIERRGASNKTDDRAVSKIDDMADNMADDMADNMPDDMAVDTTVGKAAGRVVLKKARCAEKDQSYVLYNLPREILSHVLFPLGDMSKEAVRGIAREQGFASAEKKESQDICFIPEGRHAAFIERYTGRSHAEGAFVNTAGQVLGTHRGLAYYTVGQRKGLGVVLHKPMYVLAKDVTTNTVVLGDAEELPVRSFEASHVNWLIRNPEDGPFTAAVKIRYRHGAAPALLTPLPGGNVRVDFHAPQRSVAPGQAAVFYENDTVIGGGTIC